MDTPQKRGNDNMHYLNCLKGYLLVDTNKSNKIQLQIRTASNIQHKTTGCSKILTDSTSLNVFFPCFFPIDFLQPRNIWERPTTSVTGQTFWERPQKVSNLSPRAADDHRHDFKLETSKKWEMCGNSVYQP